MPKVGHEDLGHIGISAKRAKEELNDLIKRYKDDKYDILVLVTGHGATSGNHKIKTAVLEGLEKCKCENRIKDYFIGSQIPLSNPYASMLYYVKQEDKNAGTIILILRKEK